MQLPDYITIITGHSSGLGEKLALSMQYDSYVIGISRTINKNLICKQIDFDISNYKKMQPVIEDNILGNSKINLVLSAGILGEPEGIENANFDSWEKIIRTNLFGNLSIIKAFLPQMIKTQYGRIVFVSGGGAAYGYPLFSAYAISKVSVVREVENIAIEMKDKIKNFSIIALAPGAMETKMLEKVKEAGGEIKTLVDINEPVEFIKNFISMPNKQAKKLSGKFIHVRDDLKSRNKKDKWFLRRIS